MQRLEAERERLAAALERARFEVPLKKMLRTMALEEAAQDQLKYGRRDDDLA